MDRSVSRDEIHVAVWNCGENKSPGPDGYTFEFFRRYWRFNGSDFCSVVECFFESRSFPKGIVTKILANRLATVILDLVSDIQSAFVANRQIIDGPFILNELLAWCKRKKKQAMIFKVDFAKAYDSIRWDYLLDILQVLILALTGASGFEAHLVPQWLRSWLMGALLLNSLFLATSDGLFKGIQIQGLMAISHLFYADDAVFIGEWSDSNLDNIVKILKCFFLASRLKINIQKSQVFNVGVPRNIVNQAASLIGCAVMQNPFRCLGVMVGDSMSRKLSWDDTVQNLRSRLSKWKVKTLSIRGRLTLLKSVLGASWSGLFSPFLLGIIQTIYLYK
nr:RNA-directed DNA polymerase, eukaryota [Tanacetum cinerariifolium]